MHKIGKIAFIALFCVGQIWGFKQPARAGANTSTYPPVFPMPYPYIGAQPVTHPASEENTAPQDLYHQLEHIQKQINTLQAMINNLQEKLDSVINQFTQEAGVVTDETATEYTQMIEQEHQQHKTSISRDECIANGGKIDPDIGNVAHVCRVKLYEGENNQKGGVALCEKYGVLAKLAKMRPGFGSYTVCSIPLTQEQHMTVSESIPRVAEQESHEAQLSISQEECVENGNKLYIEEDGSQSCYVSTRQIPLGESPTEADALEITQKRALCEKYGYPMWAPRMTGASQRCFIPITKNLNF